MSSVNALIESGMAVMLCVDDFEWRCATYAPKGQERPMCCDIASVAYWGLRDYGTEGQIGLEKTPQEYVDKIVAVFREVKRVLRDDGVCFVNLGSSYASGDKSPSRSLSPSHDRAYGNDGKGLQDYPAIDSFYSDLCDGCSHVLLNRTSSNDRQQPEQSALPSLQIAHDSEHSDCEPSPVPSQPVSFQESRQQQSSLELPATCRHCANCDACLSVLRSTLRESRLCARKKAYPYEQDSSLDDAQDFVAGQSNNRGTGETDGGQPACKCDAPSVPCTVLDPFGGAGTTVLVADKLGRRGIGLELKHDYCRMAERRCYDDAPLLMWASSNVAELPLAEDQNAKN